MHSDIAQRLHSTPRAIFPHFACITKHSFIKGSSFFFPSPLHNTSWCRLYFVQSHILGRGGGVHRVLFSVHATWGGSSCLLCLQVWHSTFAVYHKNAIKIIIDLPQNRSNVACPVSCHLMWNWCSIEACFCVRICALHVSFWVKCLVLEDKVTWQNVFTRACWVLIQH